LSKQDRTLRSHVYIAPIGGGEERHVSDRLMYAENNAVWTGDGRYLVFVSSESAGAGIASQSGVATTMELWALPLKDQDRDTRNRDIDNEAQARAADASNRQGGRGAGPNNNGQSSQVQIDWNGITRRSRRLSVPGNAISALTPSPDGRSVAFNLGGGGGGGRGGAAAQATAGIYVINVESGQLSRIPPAPAGARGDGNGGGRGNGGGGGGGGASLAFSRDGRTLYFRSGTGLFAANVPAGGGGGAPAAGGGRGGRGGGAAAPESDNGDAPAPAANGATARQVTYTVNIEVDHKALRAQVFNEGWRIMKNRFYDEKMHGADWESARAIYSELLDNIVDEEELHTVMMMMIG